MEKRRGHVPEAMEGEGNSRTCRRCVARAGRYDGILVLTSVPSHDDVGGFMSDVEFKCGPETTHVPHSGVTWTLQNAEMSFLAGLGRRRDHRRAQDRATL